jgi:hypothetical protein
MRAPPGPSRWPDALQAAESVDRCRGCLCARRVPGRAHAGVLARGGFVVSPRICGTCPHRAQLPDRVARRATELTLKAAPRRAVPNHPLAAARPAAAHLKRLQCSAGWANVCSEPGSGPASRSLPARAPSQVFNDDTCKQLPGPAAWVRPPAKGAPMVVRAPGFQARARRVRTPSSSQLSLAQA